MSIKSAILATILLTLMFSSATIWAAGELDTTFNVAAYQLAGYSANPPMIVQPDGKVIIGFFDWGVNNGIAAKSLSRFNPDGTVDASFNPPRLSSGTVASFGLQSNGKILIRGSFTLENSPYKGIARLNTDGSLDTTFNLISTPLPNDGYEIFVQPDDSFFTGSVYKFDANGFPVNSFQYQPYVARATNIAGLPDGKVYVGFQVPMSSGFDYLTRHNTHGTRDKSFSGVQPNRNIRKMIVLPDGKLLIAGPFTFVNSTPVGRIARLNTDGSVDSTFNPGGAGANSDISDVELLPDGKLLIGGTFDSYNGVTKRRFARLNSDGTLDSSFTFNGYLGLFSDAAAGNLEILPNGKIVVSGYLYGLQQLRASIIMLNADGSQSSEFFVQKALYPQRIRKTTVQADGKIYLAGEFGRINGYERKSVARLNPDGTVDTSFVPFFQTQTGGQIIHQVLVQPDGKILLAFSNGFIVARLNPNGTRDTSFTSPLPPSASVYDLALQADGKILIAGESASAGNPAIFMRLNSDGSVDTTYNPPMPNDVIYRVLVQPDGKRIICGEFTQISTSSRNRIARYNADGTLDQTFNPAGGANGDIYDIDLQTDGKIVVGGTFSILNGSSERNKIGRLNPDGSLDLSFAQTANTVVQTVKVQPDGKVLIGGLFGNVGGVPREKLARLNADGSLDLTFNASADALVFDINLQADGKILVAGDFTKVNNVLKMSVARLNNSAPPDNLFDYDGDGRADISVFRPSENKWYILRSSNSTVAENIFAIAGDVPVPADFDGDGKTDIAVFRPSTGDWWYLSSINNAQVFAHWGQTGDIPRPSDFDGDGKADYIVYRPSNSVWYRLGTTGATSILAFGIAEDKPVPADYDGDGKADIAVFRPSSGVWYLLRSTSGFTALQFGSAGDIPTENAFIP